MQQTRISLIISLLILLFSSPLFGHEGGHGEQAKTWRFTNSDETLTGDFIKNDGQKVYLLDENHKVQTFALTAFEISDQRYIQEKTSWIEDKNILQNERIFSADLSYLFIFLGVGFLLFSFSKRNRTRKPKFLALSLLGVSLIIMGCKTDPTKDIQIVESIKMVANDPSFLEGVFGKFKKVSTRHDEKYFYVESDGIPEHEMMTGITNWQQQLPINHKYSGSNAWAIPLQPEIAAKPLSTKDNFMKGAIALAVNGIPIFNPLNNRGEDANTIGELDKWGGHCGRADDYHYHVPPHHLQSKVGEDKPIAYALDGFPVYGETSEKLDENLGRFTSENTYQYHAIKKYPYLIAAMKGKVKFNPRTQAPENEIMPQAKTRGVRPDLRPLRGAKIIGFETIKPEQYRLTYTLDSSTHTINYGWDNDGNYNYEFINPDGKSTKSTYKRK